MDLERKAIERLQFASETSLTHYSQPLMLTYSGGKDSDVLLELALSAGIPMEVVHSHTTADAPETVRYVKQRLYGLELGGIPVSVKYPMYKGKRVSLWSLIPLKKMPPTRTARYCCQVCKEGAGNGRAVATGVRWAESIQRRGRGEIEVVGKTRRDAIILHDQENGQTALSDLLILNNDNDNRRRWMERCQMRGKTVFNPIIDWSDRDVWRYLHDCRRETNPCYSRYGLHRVGCVGCPLSGKKRYREFEIWPAYREMYLNAFSRMLDVRKAEGRHDQWQSAEDVFQWWMEENPDQTVIDGWEG